MFKKFIIGIAILFLICVGVSFPVCGEDESIKELSKAIKSLESLLEFKPNVFRDIEWGTSIEECQNMVLLDKGGNLKIYRNQDDILEIDGGKLQRRLYCFYKDQLMSLYIETQGENNFKVLKRLAVEKFGEGMQFDESIPKWSWLDIFQDTIRSLEYDTFTRKSTFITASIKIYNQYKKEKSKIQKPTSEWSGVISWRGSGIKTTEPFEIKNKTWRIKWENLGSILQIYLYRIDGQLVDILVNSSGREKDITYVYQSGKFYLTMNAIADWEVVVEEKN